MLLQVAHFLAVVSAIFHLTITKDFRETVIHRRAQFLGGGAIQPESLRRDRFVFIEALDIRAASTIQQLTLADNTSQDNALDGQS